MEAIPKIERINVCFIPIDISDPRLHRYSYSLLRLRPPSMSSFKVETTEALRPRSSSPRAGMTTDSGSSTDDYVEDPPSELDWTFSRAIETMKKLGPESAKKHLALTFQNLTVLGDPVGDSLVSTVWSSANPLELIRSLRHSKKEPRVSSKFPRERLMLIIFRLSSMRSLVR